MAPDNFLVRTERLMMREDHGAGSLWPPPSIELNAFKTLAERKN
jgi:hypothetical protein